MVKNVDQYFPKAWRDVLECLVSSTTLKKRQDVHLIWVQEVLPNIFFGWLVMNLGSNYLSHRCSSCPQPTDNQLTVVEECCWGMRKYSHLRIWHRNICGTKWLKMTSRLPKMWVIHLAVKSTSGCSSSDDFSWNQNFANQLPSARAKLTRINIYRLPVELSEH